MHHGETSNTYTGYRALINVLANHRAGYQWPGTMFIAPVYTYTYTLP